VHGFTLFFPIHATEQSETMFKENQMFYLLNSVPKRL